MVKFVRVAKESELQNGAKKEVLAEGTKLLLVRVGDNYYACQARCPHWE